jgi:hypothetical protein
MVYCFKACSTMTETIMIVITKNPYSSVHTVMISQVGTQVGSSRDPLK